MEWLLTRVLRNETGSEVIVKVGVPQPTPDGYWACKYSVSSPLEEEAQTHGLDSLQALLLSIKALYVVLGRTSQALTWEGGEPGDTGVPRIPSMSCGLALRSHVERMIGAEEDFWNSITASQSSGKGRGNQDD